MSGTQPSRPPTAAVRRSRISWVWLIPVVAAIIAGWLAWRTLRDQGPLITISFGSGEGLTPGQTRVRYKAVELGVVENVRLSDDMSHVVVTARMRQEAAPYLTDKTRFWVVRARLSAGTLTGIETLVSGSYIEMDPGKPGGKEQYAFRGLERPPGVRTGEPGSVYRLVTERIGSLGPGAPVFYRDIAVGEVLGYDIGNGLGPVTLSIFVRSPYDGFVRKGSHFWNASGVSVEVGTQGVHLELASLQALLAGGVAFDAPKNPDAARAAPGAEFRLYPSLAVAEAADYTAQPFATYFESSVRGLTPGAAVDFYGIQVGTVTSTDLELDPNTARARARVLFDVQLERISTQPILAQQDPIELMRRLVSRGLRAQLRTASYLTGSSVLSLDFVPNAAKAELTQLDDRWVVPSVGGGLENILAALSNIAGKLDSLPLDQIGANLNGTLRSASGAMTSLSELASRANSGLSPMFQRLPAITAGLEAAVTRADRTFSSLDRGYGKDSEIQRELSRAVVQVGDAARSVRALADYLDRHPEALVRGR